MKTVAEVSGLSGVSVKTLHHYHRIGLLEPSYIGENGYRYYDHAALERLQDILMLKSLDFSLADIKEIVMASTYDRKRALSDQIQLLELKKARLDRIIAHAQSLIEGEDTMNFTAFDQTEQDRLQAEAKARWGQTQAYAEFEERYEPGKEQVFAQEMAAIFADFGKWQSLGADHPDVQAQVGKLQAYITDNFYTCTNEILAGLGVMYVEDERFTKSIDRAGGPGTAQFVNRAIEIYCQ